MEIAIKMNGAVKSFVANINTDKAKTNCYKSSSTNKRKDIALIKAGLSKGKATVESKLADHKLVFENLITVDSGYPFAELFPEACYPLEVTDAHEGMILDGTEPVWVKVGVDGSIVE